MSTLSSTFQNPRSSARSSAANNIGSRAASIKTVHHNWPPMNAQMNADFG
jgi:hypothetical protein